MAHWAAKRLTNGTSTPNGALTEEATGVMGEDGADMCLLVTGLLHPSRGATEISARASHPPRSLPAPLARHPARISVSPRVPSYVPCGPQTPRNGSVERIRVSSLPPQRILVGSLLAHEPRPTSVVSPRPPLRRE